MKIHTWNGKLRDKYKKIVLDIYRRHKKGEEVMDLCIEHDIPDRRYYYWLRSLGLNAKKYKKRNPIRWTERKSVVNDPSVRYRNFMSQKL